MLYWPGHNKTFVDNNSTAHLVLLWLGKGHQGTTDDGNAQQQGRAGHHMSSSHMNAPVKCMQHSAHDGVRQFLMLFLTAQSAHTSNCAQLAGCIQYVQARVVLLANRDRCRCIQSYKCVLTYCPCACWYPNVGMAAIDDGRASPGRTAATAQRGRSAKQLGIGCGLIRGCYESSMLQLVVSVVHLTTRLVWHVFLAGLHAEVCSAAKVWRPDVDTSSRYHHSKMRELTCCCCCCRPR
ncbi:hypothetical protein COO60DRAFT_1167648 [Scenedesmus sp. NREL 46B-D3]|nr:hypothetical protein COO60DRAFT_1167648 [Scenedesmus sp. NREL 46B-D3]